MVVHLSRFWRILIFTQNGLLYFVKHRLVIIIDRAIVSVMSIVNFLTPFALFIRPFGQCLLLVLAVLLLL